MRGRPSHPQYLNRRQLLSGAGVSIARPRLKTLPRAASPGVPRRFVCVANPFGMIENAFLPTEDGLKTALPVNLAAFEPLRGRFTGCSNLNHRNKAGQGWVLPKLPDPGLLAGTQVLFGSGMSAGGLQTHKNLPVPFAVGGDKHRTRVILPDAVEKRVPLCKLCLSAAQRFGVEAGAFGRRIRRSDRFDRSGQGRSGQRRPREKTGEWNGAASALASALHTELPHQNERFVQGVHRLVLTPDA
jgi:hypothetical protein